LISANGSVQNIHEIPDNLKALYKTAWELSQKSIIEMSADRGAFICQSQSLNLFVENANFGKLSSMHFFAWEKGLKTGMYYLRTKAATDAIKFTVDKKYKTETVPANAEAAIAAGTAAAYAVEPVAVVAPQFEMQTANAEQASMTAEEIAKQQAALSCSLDNPDACEMCSG
jgi:ribonucleoside-diphosphate reductase alpha chain